MGFTKYLKAAFVNPWNLLVFLGGMGFAALSGHPDVAIPLVMAGEITYLSMLGAHPKFQKSVDAQQAKANRQDGMQAAETTARRILQELPKKQVQRFHDLRSRCDALRKISARMREPLASGEPPPLDDMQLASLDRLLWMYLRLLYTQHALSQFLTSTSEIEIQSNINLLEERLRNMPDTPNEERRQRVNKVVEDNLATSRARLENYRKAQENHELMSLELDRLENTIHSLSELSVNRQEPDFISGQIDQVAASMKQTEKTMGELEFVTGLHTIDDEVPPMLRRGVAVQE
jgi:hypothetical protein